MLNYIIKKFSFFTNSFLVYILIKIIIVVFIILFWCQFSQGISIAQTLSNGIRWGNPEMVFEHDEKGVWFTRPVPIADSNHEAHVFFGGGGNADYPGSVWHTMMQKTGWTEPVDIIAPLSNSNSINDVILDSLGRFDLLWGTPGNAPIYWSWADSLSANSAANWHGGSAISHDAAFTASMSEIDGHIYVVYGVTGAAMRTTLRGVYFISKSIIENGWSMPVLIAPANIDRGISDVEMSVDSRGCIHVVWSETILTGYPPTGVYYARSCDNGYSWSLPNKLFGPDKGDPRIVTAKDSEVHVISLGRNGYPGRFHRWSDDGGKTWSHTNMILSNQFGLSGAGLGVDSAGVVHWILTGGGNRDVSGQYILHTAWENGKWSQPERISKSLSLPAGQRYEEPELTIVDGNHLLITWLEFGKDSSAHHLTRIWFVEGWSRARSVSSRTEISVHSLPDTNSSSINTPTLPEENVVRKTTLEPPAISRTSDIKPPNAKSTLLSPIILGVLFAMVSVSLVLFYQFYRKRLTS